MNEKINILNIELYQTSAKAAMQKVVQYMESDSINTVEIITMDMLLKGKDMPGWKEAVESLNLVLPGETEFKSDGMRRVYQGIFVKQAVLFDGEVLEYEIYDDGQRGRELRQKGKIDAAAGKGGGSRFSSLNRMGVCLTDGDMDGLKREMRDYLIKTGTVEEMFDLM